VLLLKGERPAAETKEKARSFFLFSRLSRGIRSSLRRAVSLSKRCSSDFDSDVVLIDPIANASALVLIATKSSWSDNHLV
jgi:hypothetical protein